MTTGDDAQPGGLPLILPSPVDPDYECVLVDPEAAAAPPPPTPGDGAEVEQGTPAPLCPPGYVPRARPRPPYEAEGKEVISTDPPVENPEPPPR